MTTDEKERPLMVELTVYYWHQNPNSITRSVKDFIYNDNIVGYVENIRYAIRRANCLENKNKFFVLKTIVQTMADLYIFYEEVSAKKPEYDITNFKAIVEFYKEFFETIELTQDSSFINKSIQEEMATKKDTLANFIPKLTYFQFMDKIREQVKKDYEQED
jgi:hypothetical protein